MARYLLAIALLLASILCGWASNPSVIEDRDIDRLFVLCADLAKKSPHENCFGQPEFLRQSKKIADRWGVSIIRAVMRRARVTPRDEQIEGPWAVLLAVVALLPRDESTQMLREYEKSGNAAERKGAHEYLTEFELSAKPEIMAKAVRDL